MTRQPYDAWDYFLGQPIPPTHSAYQCRRGAELLSTCAARTADDAYGRFHDVLGIDPVGTSVIPVSSRHPVTVIGE